MNGESYHLHHPSPYDDECPVCWAGVEWAAPRRRRLSGRIAAACFLLLVALALLTGGKS